MCDCRSYAEVRAEAAMLVEAAEDAATAAIAEASQKADDAQRIAQDERSRATAAQLGEHS